MVHPSGRVVRTVARHDRTRRRDVRLFRPDRIGSDVAVRLNDAELGRDGLRNAIREPAHSRHLADDRDRAKVV